MKRIDAAMVHCTNGIILSKSALSELLRAAGVDPEEEMPQAARWWEIGEKPTKGWYHGQGESVEMFASFSGLWNDTGCSFRWHGPHATRKAAEEHYRSTVAQSTPTPDTASLVEWATTHYHEIYNGVASNRDLGVAQLLVELAQVLHAMQRGGGK